MKIIITGASGFLGREVCLSAFRRGYEILAIGGKTAPQLPIPHRSFRINLIDFASLESLILEEFPQFIINCAALSTISECEQNPILAQHLNVDVPRHLSKLAFHLGSKLVHVSTDMVFDGEKGKYLNTDLPNPLSLYGRLKATGEAEVLKYGREHATVIRTSLLNGNSLSGSRGLHERLFKEWVAGYKVKLFTDEFRQPVGLSNLADTLIEICERTQLTGVYHWAGSESLSRYDIGVKIARHFDLEPTELLLPEETINLREFYNRPRDLSLLLDPLVGKLKISPQTFSEQLTELRIPRNFETWYELKTGKKIVRRLEKGVDY